MGWGLLGSPCIVLLAVVRKGGLSFHGDVAPLCRL